MIANYYKAGPATKSGVRQRIAQPSSRGADEKCSWHVANSYVDGHPDVTANNRLGVDGDEYIKMDERWDAISSYQEDPEAAYRAVLEHAGCSLPNLDALDQRIIEKVRTGSVSQDNNGIVTSPGNAGG